MIEFDAKKLIAAAEVKVQSYENKDLILEAFADNLSQLEIIWIQINKDLEEQNQEVEVNILIDRVVNTCLDLIHKMYLALSNDPEKIRDLVLSDELPDINNI